LRDRRVARVIDREIAPIWHDRFARLIIRNLPGASDVIALDIHCGVGRTTAELLGRLGSAARVLAIEPDDTLIEFAKTRMRPEWKNRVYLKPGNFDDVTAMADDSYNLVVANLVLGDAGDIGSALTEMIRVNRIGGRILATLPMAGSWDEVEDIFAEVLRDAGLTAAVRRLERLRELRPTGAQLAKVVRDAGVAEDDLVIEQERFQLLFPSGREFLFAPVVEHGPLRLWKAVIGKDGSPQELFWRLKEAIDTYYTGHVLAVNVIAGLMNINVAKGTESPGPRLAARYWRHYSGLDALWGGLASGYVRVSEPSLPAFGEGDFDFDLEIDDGEVRRTGTQAPVTTSVDIITEDFYDPEPSSESPGALGTAAPTKPATRFSPAARVGAGPAKSISTIKSAQAAQSAARLKRPPVAEDDFSDLDDQVTPTSTPQRGDLRDAFAAQHADARDDAKRAEDKVDEPTNPTSTSRQEQRAAVQPEPTPTEANDRPDDDLEAIDEVEAIDEFDEVEPVDEVDVSAAASSPAPVSPAPVEAVSPAPVDETPQAITYESDIMADALEAARKAHDADEDAREPDAALGLSRRPLSAPRSLDGAGTTGVHLFHDGFTRPSSESSGFTRPSSESSGFTRPFAAEPSGPRPSAESSGFTRPSAESSGFTRPSAESSGFTPPPASESASFRRPPSTPLPATGSFRVFAPPPPRGSDSDAPDPGISASDLQSPEAESESASVLAELADLRDNLPHTLERREPEQPGPSDEVDDDLDELDELDEDLDDEPAPVTRSAPPPPPKAPPPPPSNLSKPRPLLPIVPPKKK